MRSKYMCTCDADISRVNKRILGFLANRYNTVQLTEIIVGKKTSRDQNSCFYKYYVKHISIKL